MKLSCLGALLVATVVGAAGCSSSVPSESSSDDHLTESAKLSFGDVLPELAAQGISGTVRRLTDTRLSESVTPDVSPTRFSENRYYLEVSFGKLTRAQFDVIAKVFGGVSKVPYDEQRAYELVDFLHPAMQAVVNTTLAPTTFDGSRLAFTDDDLGGDPQAVAFYLQRNGIYSSANCFGTTTEILRQLHSDRHDAQYLLYMPDRIDTTDRFRDDAYSAVVAAEDVQPGDVLVIERPQAGFVDGFFVAHTAILLSKELLFEKTDASSNDPYRISLRKDVLAMYERYFASVGEKERVVYRRFNQPGKKMLPAPSLPANALTERQQAVVKAAFPEVHAENVIMTKEVRFGGGFDFMAEVVEPAEIVVDPSTGRGRLHADAALLARFVALKPTE